MQTFIKLGLSSIAIAALVACGGGGDTVIDPPVTPSNIVAPGASVAAFVTSGTSKVISLGSCTRDIISGGQSVRVNMVGATGSVTLSANGDISFSYQDNGSQAPAVPAIDFTRNFARSTSLVNRDADGIYIYRENGATSYYFESRRDTGIIEASFSGGAVFNSNDNYVSLRFDDNNNTYGVLCGFSADPQMSTNITDYNARIASLGSATLVAPLMGSGVTAQSLAGNVVSWQNTNHNPAGTRYRFNTATGIFSYLTATATNYADFNTNTNMASSTGSFSYSEERRAGSDFTEVMTQLSNTGNDYDYYNVNLSTTLGVQILD